jgi:hypothetical protein
MILFNVDTNLKLLIILNQLLALKDSARLKLAPILSDISLEVHLKHTVCFTDLDQGSEIISKFKLPKSMKHTVSIRNCP